MIGVTPFIIGTEPKVPNFNGSADVVFDGKYLWISNRDNFGEPNINAKNKMIWVVDPSTGIPRVIAKIDLTSFAFRVVRSLNVSNNGLYIYACLAGTLFPTVETGRCLVINKNTFQIVGNAQVTTANIGTPSPSPGGRAVYALDDGADHLWVVNSNQSNGNGIERFSLATVLANGASPTTSAQVVNITQPFHAEELTLGGGFMWTATSDYTNGVTRINPTNGALTNFSTSHVVWGPKFLGGALWGGDFGRSIVRMNPALFGLAGFITDVVALTPTMSGSNAETLGSFAYDGTFIWTGGAFNSYTTTIAAGSNGQSLPQSTINVQDTTVFPSSGSININIGGTPVPVFYTGKTANSFTGCTGGFGTMFTNNSVFSRIIKVHKLSTGSGTVSIVKTVTVVVPTNNGQGSFNLCFDGQYIWGVQRVLGGICGLFKIDPTPGAEKAVMVWPTGGALSQQT